MVKVYEDLTEQEQDQLSHAWRKIYEGLLIYEEVTGASDLDDIVYDDLWEAITFQKGEEV